MKKFISRFLVCLAITSTFLFADVVIAPMIAPSAVEVQAATKVKISSSKKTLYVKETTTLEISGTSKKVTWSSSNKKVATVTKKGKVTAVKKGTATITAKVGSKKYTCKITVKNPTLSSKKASVKVGSKKTLTVKNAVGKVKWSSSNKAVATVSKKGVVTGKKAGTATITAKASGVKLTCKVTVKKVAVTGITLDKTSASLNEGKTLTLKATVAPSNATDKTVTWTSSNNAAATVSSTGVVTAKKAGTATITAKAGSKTATCTVTVKANTVAVTGITLDQTTASLTEGGTVTLKAAVAPSNATDKTVTWTTSDSTIATVSSTGVVTAKKAGTATITAKAGSKTAACKITVTAKPVAVTGVTLDKSEEELIAGGTITLTATVAPANATDKTLTWTSGDTSVAAVENGVVTAVKDGETDITVTTASGSKTAVCHITVKTVMTDLSIANSQIQLSNGEELQLEVSPVPATCQGVTYTYTSSDEDVVTVEKNSGKVTGVNTGRAVITVRAEDKYNNVKIKVVNVDVTTHASGINLNSTAEKLYVHGTFTITATILPQETADKSVTFTSSAPEVAKVAENGIVTAMQVGSAVITVTSVDNPALSAQIEITVAEAKTVSVSTSEEMEEALSDPDVQQINIDSAEALNLEIPEGDHSEVSLIINAPKGHIENHAVFKDITILAIGPDTFVEYATGNQINYAAETGSIRIEEGAQASITTLDGAGELNLTNNGYIDQLTVASDNNNISITGSGSQLSVPVKVASGAENTTVNTSVMLAVDAEEKISLVIAEGGEHTFVTVDDEEAVPDVSGLGRIEVTVSKTGQVDNIIAESTGDTESRSVIVNGLVRNAPAGTMVYIIPYASGLTQDTVDITAARAAVETDGDGSYTTDAIPIGNYYLYVNEEGYIPVFETLIITSAESEVYSAQTADLIPDAEDVLGGLEGALVDAETGERVPAGLTVILRQGGNNISGEYLTYTMTDESGAFSFDGLALGTYTIQILDQRDDPDEYFVTTSYNASVLGEGTYNADNSLTRIITSNQVRFILQWGDEASGASSDLDSHLVGPGEGGIGQFHTWYGDQGYYADGITMADLDLDDTTWIGPETTTIYVKSSGIYSFYVHDYTNGHNASSTQMSRSSASVKVFIGSREMATYYCPNETGNLWYVCDYDPATNAFTPKNIMMGYTDDTSDIGVDLVERYRGRLQEAITDLEAIFAEFPDLNPDGISLEHAKDVLNNSEDYEELRSEYNQIRSYVDDFNYGLEIGTIYAYDENGTNVVSGWSKNKEDSLWKLTIRTYADTLPALEVFANHEDSTAEVIASDVEGYTQAIKVTNSQGCSRIYYISSSKYINLSISSVRAEDEDGTNLITDWWSDWEYDDNDEEYYILLVKGVTETLPENLTITLYTPEPYAAVEIKASDRTGYEKMAVVSGDGNTRQYYISYSQNIYLSIESITAEDESGNNLISGWWTEWGYDDDDNEYRILSIHGAAESLPESLSIVPRYAKYGVSAEIKDSDRSDYKKMLVLTAGENTQVHYIEYSCSVRLYIDEITAYDEDYDNQINSYSIQSQTIGEKAIQIISITGFLPEMPELTVEGYVYDNYNDDYYYDVTEEVVASDLEEYEKMIVLSRGSLTQKYYIVYTQGVPLRISNVFAEDEDGENIIDSFFTTTDWDETDGEIPVLVVKGVPEALPEFLTVTPGYTEYGVTAEVKASDRSGYEYMAVLSSEYGSKNYYIRYTQEMSLWISRVRAEDESGNNLIHDWSIESDYDGDTDDWYDILYIYSAEESLPESLVITPQYAKYGVTAEIKDSDRSGFEKMVVLSSGTQTRTFYIRYECSIRLNVNLTAYDDEGVNQINSYPTREVIVNGNRIKVLNVSGFPAEMPELTVSGYAYDDYEGESYYDVTAEVSDSDLEGYEKMIVLSRGSLSQTYYVLYKQDIPLSISDVRAEDEDGENILYGDWEIDWDWDEEDDVDIQILSVRGLTETLPESFTVTPNYAEYGVAAEIKDSDRSSYEKMVVLSSEFGSEVYYIRYRQSLYPSISQIVAEDEEGNNLIKEWITDSEYDEDDNYYNTIYITGSAEDLPENLSVIPNYVKYGVTAEIKDSDRSGYEKMVVLSAGEQSNTYYIDYRCSLQLYVNTLTAYDEEEANQINSYTTQEEKVNGKRIRVLNISGFPAEMPELTVSGYAYDSYEGESYYDVTAEVVASDLEGYEKMITLSRENFSQKYYIVYTQGIPLDINSVQALDEDGESLLNGWWDTWYWDEEGEEDVLVLEIEGAAPSLPESLTVTPDYAEYGVTAEIKASDRSGYEKMLVLSSEYSSKVYYIRYTGYLYPAVKDVRAEDEDGNNLIKNWWDSWEYDEDNDYRILVVQGSAESLPESLTIIPKYAKYGVTAEIKDSDRSGYEKMAVLTAGERTETSYIDYRCTLQLYVNSVTAYDEEGADQINSYYQQEVQVDSKRIQVLNVSGFPAELPELEVSGYAYDSYTYEDYYDVTAEVVDSDLEGYEKMIVLSRENLIQKYYITYEVIESDENSESR